MKSQGKFHIPQNICEASQQTSFKMEKKQNRKNKKNRLSGHVSVLSQHLTLIFGSDQNSGTVLAAASKNSKDHPARHLKPVHSSHWGFD